MSSNQCFYTLFSSGDWEFYIGATSEGLCFVGSMPASKEECLNWLSDQFTNHTISESRVELNHYIKAFQAYLSGESSSINVPVVQMGTPFQKKVWSSLTTIPYGQTITYSELAEKNGLSPKAARTVGTAIGKNPLLIVYPCHRIVPKSSSPKKFRGGLEMKTKLLELEQQSI